MVLPQTEAVQIVGRFRNGVKSISHITNVNTLSPYKSIDDVKNDIAGDAKGYEIVITLFNNSIGSSGNGFFKDILDRHPFTQLLVADKTKLNWFKYQNKLLDQLIDNTYHNLSFLLNAYHESNFFNVKELDFHNFTYDDKRFFRRAKSNKKEMRQDIVAQLENLDLTVIDDNIYEIESLEREDSLIVSAYLKLGKEFIEKVNYNENDLKIGLIKKSVEEGISTMPVMDAILDAFIVDREYTEKEIKATLNKIYQAFEIDKKATATDLDEYFRLSPRKTIRSRMEKDGKEAKGYKIESARFTKRNPGQKVDLFIQR